VGQLRAFGSQIRRRGAWKLPDQPVVSRSSCGGSSRRPGSNSTLIVPYIFNLVDHTRSDRISCSCSCKPILLIFNIQVEPTASTAYGNQAISHMIRATSQDIIGSFAVYAQIEVPRALSDARNHYRQTLTFEELIGFPVKGQYPFERPFLTQKSESRNKSRMR